MIQADCLKGYHLALQPETDLSEIEIELFNLLGVLHSSVCIGMFNVC